MGRRAWQRRLPCPHLWLLRIMLSWMVLCAWMANSVHTHAHAGFLKSLSTLNSIISLCLVMKTTWWIIHHQKDIVYTHTQVILPNYICFCGNMNDEIESVIYLVFKQMFHHHYFFTFMECISLTKSFVHYHLHLVVSY